MDLKLSQDARQMIDHALEVRGATLFAFAQVEWYLARLILEAKSFEQYCHLDLSFSQDASKRADRLRSILDVDGPFSAYSDRLRKPLDEVLKHEDLRNYAAHGLFVRPDPADFSLSSPIHLRMYRQFKNNELLDGKIDLTLKHYTDQQSALTSAAKDFCEVVRTMWKELKFKDLDPT